ncbi:MAG: hypothetical protein GEV09_14350 [Pseudonocardiaceae bacterium]|nr:hypothetical protein [Pseudonocardiaceae bacterium]
MASVSVEDLVAGATLLPGSAQLLALRQHELPQRDEMCGPFCALLALWAAGIGGELDQDDVALAAATVLSPPPRTASLPPGERGRGDFRLALPQAVVPSAAGTAATGVARAVEELSDGQLAAVPASGDWAPEGVHALLRGAGRLDGPVGMLANIATAELADHRTGADTLLRYLDTGTDEAASARWHTGHFVALAGLIEGPVGRLVLVADSYRSLGSDGLHLQPVERLTAALRREGLPPGGVLLVVPADQRPAAMDVVTSAGLRTQLWDNGSRDAGERPGRS